MMLTNIKYNIIFCIDFTGSKACLDGTAIHPKHLIRKSNNDRIKVKNLLELYKLLSLYF